MLACMISLSYANMKSYNVAVSAEHENTKSTPDNQRLKYLCVVI